MTDKTNAKRQAEHRRRRREMGQVQLLLWVHRSNKEKIRELAKELEQSAKE